MAEELIHDSFSSKRRIDDLKREIHVVNQDLLSMYDTQGGFLPGFQILFTNLSSIFSEISDDLSEKEKESVISDKEKIESFLMDNPIYIKKIILRYGARKTVGILEKDNWLKLKNMLFKFQLKIFNLEAKYSASTKTKTATGEA